jgi:hypothetical protein
LGIPAFPDFSFSAHGCAIQGDNFQMNDRRTIYANFERDFANAPDFEIADKYFGSNRTTRTFDSKWLLHKRFLSPLLALPFVDSVHVTSAFFV